MTSIGSTGLWAGFLVFVALMLALDLGVFHRKAHAPTFREASIWSIVWISLALIFNGGLYWYVGTQPALEFLTAYVVEKSLSVDNIFVFAVIFASLKIPTLYQHRVLFWGILSALVLRAIMIFAGTALLDRFHWLIYVFGAFLLFTGVKLFLSWRSGEEEVSEDGWAMRTARRFIPFTQKLDGSKFFTVENGKKMATPLFLALIVVEISDVLFALDSIPAVFAVTRDPFIVFTSNIFAILGLRSLFFLLAGMLDRFTYLKVGLSMVLAFVGVKMILIDLVKVPPAVSLGVIALMLGLSVVISLLRPPRPAAPVAPAPAPVPAERE